MPRQDTLEPLSPPPQRGYATDIHGEQSQRPRVQEINANDDGLA